MSYTVDHTTIRIYVNTLLHYMIMMSEWSFERSTYISGRYGCPTSLFVELMHGPKSSLPCTYISANHLSNVDIVQHEIPIFAQSTIRFVSRQPPWCKQYQWYAHTALFLIDFTFTNTWRRPWRTLQFVAVVYIVPGVEERLCHYTLPGISGDSVWRTDYDSPTL